MNESIFEKNDGEAIRKIEPKFYVFSMEGYLSTS